MEYIVSPVNSEAHTSRQLLSKADTLKALDLSKSAIAPWRKTPIDARVAIVNKFIDIFLSGKEAIAKEISWLIGRPLRHSMNEMKGFEERARYLTSIAKECLQDIPVEGKAKFKRYIRKEPLGIVFIIAPWNYPYLTAVNGMHARFLHPRLILAGILPSLLAGNTVILKHSPQTFPCAERLHDAFIAAGLPTGVFQVSHAL